MKDKLCENVVKVRRVGDRVMAVVVVWEEDERRLICGFAHQCEKVEEKQSFND